MIVMKFNKFITLHTSFAKKEYHISDKVYPKQHKLKINIGILKDDDGLSHYEKKDIQISSGSFSFAFEAMIPILSLSGHELRIFIFLIAYYVDLKSGRFKWNVYVIEAYKKYYKAITADSVETSTIVQEFKKLVIQNIVQRSDMGNYLMNPSFLPRARTESNIVKPFNEYVKKNFESKKNASESLEFKRYVKGKASSK